MEQIKVGFLGAGNMASAILNGILTKELLQPSEIAVFDIDTAKVEKLAQKGVVGKESAKALVKAAKYIFLAVKPQHLEELLASIKGAVNDDHVFVSIAAGISESFIKEKLERNVHIVLAMPNTPLLLGYGATAVSRAENTSDEEFRFVADIFAGAGEVAKIRQDQMNEIIPINGSAPAFIYLFTKLYIESAVKAGIPKDIALKLFSQTLIGSAKMMTESGYSLDELIKMVSSPGGTTIAGLRPLEEGSFQKAVSDSFDACVKRAYELGK